MFDIFGTKSLDSNAIDFVDNGVNFVGRTFENNGIQGKIVKQTFEPNEPFTITATVIGNYKYVKLQKEHYYCSQNINRLTPKPIIKNWNYKIAYFFIANIQRFVSLYDGQQGGYKLDIIKKHIVHVPIKNKKIDLEFIEVFMTKIEAERMVKLDAYLLATGLKDYALTVEEQQVLRDFEQAEFKEFKVTDIFDVNNSKSILSRDIVEDSGTTPYLCASADNNAVSSYITYDNQHLDTGNCVFIGGKTFEVTYQEKDFYSNDSHNLILHLKNTEKSKSNQLYLATCVKKGLAHKYSWGDSISNRKIQKDIILLPIKDNKPDYEVMDILISAIQKLVIKDVVLYVNDKMHTQTPLNESNYSLELF